MAATVVATGVAIVIGLHAAFLLKPVASRFRPALPSTAWASWKPSVARCPSPAPVRSAHLARGLALCLGPRLRREVAGRR